MEYEINEAKTRPRLDGKWDSPAWQPAQTGEIASFHRRSSDHRPVTQFRVLHDERGLYLIFRVQDRYVSCTHTELQSSVCRDSCVEAFLEPKPGKGYFNFEINCGGTLLLFYIEDPHRTPGKQGINKSLELPISVLKKVKIYHSMPRVVQPEIKDPIEWVVEYFVPYEVFEQYVGPLEDPCDRRWRGNFYKCGDATSHPHWASWNSIGPKLNFHQPEFFAPIRFAGSKTAKAHARCALQPA